MGSFKLTVYYVYFTFYLFNMLTYLSYWFVDHNKEYLYHVRLEEVHSLTIFAGNIAGSRQGCVAPSASPRARWRACASASPSCRCAPASAGRHRSSRRCVVPSSSSLDARRYCFRCCYNTSCSCVVYMGWFLMRELGQKTFLVGVVG